jgi:hypothetical protein
VTPHCSQAQAEVQQRAATKPGVEQRLVQLSGSPRVECFIVNPCLDFISVSVSGADEQGCGKRRRDGGRGSLYCEVVRSRAVRCEAELLGINGEALPPSPTHLASALAPSTRACH